MKWTVPQYGREEVDAAGQILASRDFKDFSSVEHTYKIVNNWRSSHAFPLNTMQMYLRNNSRQADPKSLVAQRVKRLSSIESKLRRFGWLKFSEMQDIGGCRAVLRSMAAVDKLVDAYKNSQIKHRLVDSDDYISNPKKSGYRGYHLIYRYHSDKKTSYNNLKIEIQIRSAVQHTWATAVETVGTFTQQALKSSQGEQDWLRFFALMGSFFAKREKRSEVPNTPQNGKELLDDLAFYADKLDVIERLRAYGVDMRAIRESEIASSRYFLLQLNIEEKIIKIRGFRANQLEEASTEYLYAERLINETTASDVVLVSVESLESLERAYPNYFLDTSRFRREVERALGTGRS